MTSHAESLGHDHDDHDEHHGPIAANQSSRVDPSTLGMFLFIASEAALFGSFFAAYFFVRVVNPTAEPWPGEGFELPVFVAGVNTAILVTSSFTVHWATQSIRRGNRSGLKAGLVLTIALGAAFLITQMVEYAHLGVNTGHSAYVSAFLGLTGLHGAHVLIGLTALTVVAMRAFRGHYSPEKHLGVEIPGIYWHFVDIMWIVVYTTLYLI